MLRRNKATAGQYAPHMVGPKLQENEADLAELLLALTGQDHATLAVPEYLNQHLRWHQDGDLDEEGKLIRSLTAQEEAVIRAWEAVQKVSTKKPRTLYKCWDEYLIWRGVDATTRAGKRSNGRWKKFAQHMPDVALNEDTPKALEQAWIHSKKQNNIKRIK